MQFTFLSIHKSFFFNFFLPACLLGFLGGTVLQNIDITWNGSKRFPRIKMAIYQIYLCKWKEIRTKLKDLLYTVNNLVT